MGLRAMLVSATMPPHHMTNVSASARHHHIPWGVQIAHLFKPFVTVSEYRANWSAGGIWKWKELLSTTEFGVK
jgi:hypothetical protein